MQDRNCTNCKHYRPVEDGEQVLDYGECRAHPPIPIVVEDALTAAYPPVTEEDDCGEWKAGQ